MSRELKDIWIDEISLVNNPANGIELMLIKNEDKKSLFSQIEGEFDVDKIRKNLSDSVINDSLGTFSKYYNELPKEMKAAIATISETFRKETGVMDKEEAKKLLLDEYDISESDFDARLKGEPTTEDKINALTEQIASFKEKLEEEEDEEEEEEEVEEIDIAELELEEAQLEQLKEKYELYNMDEVKQTVDEIYNGKENEEDE